MGARMTLVAGVVALAQLGGCKERNQYQPPPPPKVTIAAPVARKLTRTLETTGSVTAINTVDLMARVQGFLQEIDYQDGTLAKKGGVLFVIEPLPFQTRLQQAQAAEAGAQAQLAQLSAEYDRQANLGKSNFSSRANVDQARAARDAAQASLDQARGNTQLAAINYAYTRVLAPFDGIVSAHLASVGELVGTTPTRLATIVQLDPIWVSFSISEQDVLRIRAIMAAEGRQPGDANGLQVDVGLQSESGYPHAGKLDYINPGLDPATGTLTVRAVFANADHALVPGFFARVRVPIQRDVESLLVPDTALGADQAGRYVLVATTDNIVEQRLVETGPVEGDLRVITRGLKPDERVIVAGLQRAVPGEKIDPQPAAATP